MQIQQESKDIGYNFMKKRKLGNSDLHVSALGLGCMGMSMGYGPADDNASMKTLEYAIEQGINFIDTADMYGVAGKGWGHNEMLIAKALKKFNRNSMVIATKCGFMPFKDSKGHILSIGVNGAPHYIKKACEESLKRLNIECIDLYYLHRADRNIPIEDSVGALAELVKEGKVRYIGLSEVTESTLRKAVKIHPVTALQSEYSLFQRQPEKEILPVCRELGINFVPYSPLGRGILTGKYRDICALHENDFRKLLPKYSGSNFEYNLRVIDTLESLAIKNNCTAAQLAIAWLLHQGDDIVPIPGTRSMDRLNENIGAVNVQLTCEDLAEINHLIPVDAVLGEQYPEAFDFKV